MHQLSIRKSERLSAVQSDIRECPVEDAAYHGAVRLLFQKMAAGLFVICSLSHLRIYSNFRRNIYNKNKDLICFN